MSNSPSSSSTSFASSTSSPDYALGNVQQQYDKEQQLPVVPNSISTNSLQRSEVAEGAATVSSPIRKKRKRPDLSIHNSDMKKGLANVRSNLNVQKRRNERLSGIAKASSTSLGVSLAEEEEESDPEDFHPVHLLREPYSQIIQEFEENDASSGADNDDDFFQDDEGRLQTRISGVHNLPDNMASIGEARLWEHMPVFRISDLVDWATKDLSLHPSNLNMTGNNTINPNTTSATQEPTATTQTTRTKMGIPTNVSPWLHMPAPPPKPSHLKYLSDCASKKLQQSQRQTLKIFHNARDVLSKTEYKVTPLMFDHDGESSSSSSSFESLHCFSSSDEDSTYQAIKNFKRTKVMKSYLPTTQKDEEKEKQKPKTVITNLDEALTCDDWCDNHKNDPNFNLHEFKKLKQEVVKGYAETMDETALVGAGMMIEEAITAMLIPLAREHVARCRRLEAKEEKIKNSFRIGGNWTEERKSEVLRKLMGTDETSFGAWTLPPSQAIAKLSQVDRRGEAGIERVGEVAHDDDSDCCKSPFGYAVLSSSLPPTTESGLKEKNELYHHQDLEQVKDGNEMIRNKQFHHWCKVHGFDQKTVSTHKSLFRLFVDGRHC